MSGVAERWGLNRVKKLYIPTSNGKMVVPQDDSTDIIINDNPNGIPTDDYRGFPEIDLDPNNNDIWLIYGQTESHGGPSSAGVGLSTIIRKSTDAGLTWPVINTGSYIPVGGPCITATQSGRILTQHTDFANHVGNGERRPYHMYSDTGGIPSSFSALIQTATYYPNPGQVMGGPGKAIKVKNYLLKAVYNRPAALGNRGIRVLKSTDDGVSFQLLSTIIIVDSGFDYEEPCLSVAPNGMIMCAIKSETLDYSVASWSLNGGYDWSMPMFMMNSEGKNPIAFSPNGTALVIGRKFPNTDWRVIYTYWDGATWSAEQYLDARTHKYMYGGIIWHPGISKYITVYSLATHSTNGPAYLVVKYLNEVNV